MTPEEMKKLFKRFSQANSRTHIDYGGSGIGLYICHKLVERQGGGVGVASSLGEGSAFGFYIETRRAKEPSTGSPRQIALPQLPRRSSDRSGLPALALSSSLSDATPTIPDHEKTQISNRPRLTKPHTEPNPSEFNLLLVEDVSQNSAALHDMADIANDTQNLINQRILAKQLRSAKCSVTVANHGKQALHILETSDCWSHSSSHSAVVKVDVILLDWEMPVMNGLECCEQIRRLEKEGQIIRHVPVIAITANVRREQVERAMLAGFDAVMPKPFTVAELLERIREVVDSKHSRLGITDT